MAYTSEILLGESAAASTYRFAMANQASRRPYNHRLNTYEPQDPYTSGSSHQRASTHQQRTRTQKRSPSHQRTSPHQHIAPPRRHRGVLLPEASATQHQAMYLEYLRLVAAGQITDPASPPDYDNFDDEEARPQFPPPTYEQALNEAGAQTVELEPERAGRTGDYADSTAYSTRHRGSRAGSMMMASRQTATATATGSTSREGITTHAISTPAVQALQLVQIPTSIPATLPPRPKSPRFLSRVASRLRISRAA